MAELKRKQEDLTTADLAGRTDVQKQPERPQLVRKEPARQGTHEIGTREEWADAGERGAGAAASAPLFAEREITDFRSRWSTIQTAFVDEPRQAVQDADKLVASVMKRLAEGFANERSGLEKQWDRGDNVSTEDLRVALQRYRSFFDRLLKA
jgi:hypothetical protein